MAVTEVYILGQKYTIKGDAPEEYIRELSRYIDDKLREVCASSPNIAPLKAMILTSLSIADELFRLRAEQEAITAGMEEKTAALSCLFEGD